MRHRRRSKHFGRKSVALKAMYRGLIISIVEHGRIKTTVDKAKEFRRHIERTITLGKKNDLATRRLLLSRIPHNQTVDAIMSDISPRFKTREGGYTRIIKIGRRPGDTAEMAFIEFVDYDWQKSAKGIEEASSKKAGAKTKTEDKKAKVTKVEGATKVLTAKKKATAKKQQKKSRAAARA